MWSHITGAKTNAFLLRPTITFTRFVLPKCQGVVKSHALNIHIYISTKTTPFQLSHRKDYCAPEP